MLSHIKALFLGVLDLNPCKKLPKISKLVSGWSSGYQTKKAGAHSMPNIINWVKKFKLTKEESYKKICYLAQVFTLGRKVETTYMQVGDTIKEYDHSTSTWMLRVTVGRTKTSGQWTYKQEFIINNPLVVQEYDLYMTNFTDEFKSNTSNRLWQRLSKNGNFYI